MFRYRDYVIRKFLREIYNTAWIVRANGSWRYSPPTLVGADYEWQLFKEFDPGLYEQVGTAASERAAKAAIDSLMGKPATPDAAADRDGK